MQLKIQKYLLDILTSVDSINEYLGKQRNFNVYLENKQLRRSVERELEIIGEAVSKILQLNPDILIGNARKIVSLRNRVIHAYDNVDNETVWGIVVNHLPKLRENVVKLLDEVNPS
jgi:uncharacterized protein with HEPN domain